MKFSIYGLPSINKAILAKNIAIQSDTYPTPKLIKYNFNNMIGNMDMNLITSNDHYTAGLKFDFGRSDDKSIGSAGSAAFGIKHFNQTFCEIWEILNLFELFGATSVSVSHPEEMSDVFKSHKTKQSPKVDISHHKKSSTVDLVFHKFSDIDEVDENIAAIMIMTDLAMICSKLSSGSNLILQIFSCQSQFMIEVIYFLSTYFTEAYVYKPIVISDIFDSKYLVLINMTAKSIEIPKSAIVLPKKSSDQYYYKFLDNNTEVPAKFTSVFQCMNSDLFPEKFNVYSIIKKYLDSKVYEGGTYTDLIETQNKNTEEWIKMFYSNISVALETFNKAFESKELSCDYLGNLAKVFAE